MLQATLLHCCVVVIPDWLHPQAAHPHEAVVGMSAHAELLLTRWKEEGTAYLYLTSGRFPLATAYPYLTSG